MYDIKAISLHIFHAARMRKNPSRRTNFACVQRERLLRRLVRNSKLFNSNMGNVTLDKNTV